MSPDAVDEAEVAVKSETILRFEAAACDLMPRLTCIEASRVTIECLSRFGIAAEAVPVTWVVRCDATSVAVVVGLRGAERAALQAHPGLTDLTKKHGGWDGHVIVMARDGDDHYLINASFDQAAKEGSGLSFAHEPFIVPFCQPVEPSGLYAELGIVADDGQVLRVNYRFLDDYSFLDYPGWEPSHLWITIDAICERMKSL